MVQNQKKHSVPCDVCGDFILHGAAHLCTVRLRLLEKARTASETAVNSMWLLVLLAWAPDCHRPPSTTNAHPPGPGLEPSVAPSVYTCTISAAADAGRAADAVGVEGRAV